MATITKFYLRDSTSPNFGTMPSNSPAIIGGLGSTGDATGAATARDAIGTAGSANPDTESQITSNADTNPQNWGHRRFVSRPLAAGNVGNAGNWTFSYARTESNLNHNQAIQCGIYWWRPQTGATVATTPNSIIISGTEPTSAGAEQAESKTSGGFTTVTLQEGDCLVFDVWTKFTQAMGTAYTDNFAYDGTTEASTTTCASFISAPAALTLSDHPWPRYGFVNYQNPGVLMKVFGYEKRNWLWRPLKRWRLWTPELWRPEFWLPNHVAQGEIAV